MIDRKKYLIERLNQFGAKRIPVIFIIDFEIKNPVLIPVDKINNENILYDINGFTNSDDSKEIDGNSIEFKKYPVEFAIYKVAFEKAISEFKKGNSFLLNLTFPTEIKINMKLKDVFLSSKAKYKLFYKNKFIVFSPETFITIENNRITSYPMKGTIDASIHDAENKIINDEKEFAEHITIVDLIRNDLGIISKEVNVKRFRYIDEIQSFNRKLLQVSSEISGQLESGWNLRLGEIISSLLPAGSVTGAPKKKTVEIIKHIESYRRGYYTGIFGYFNGQKVESGVMIRFIEKDGGKLIYKSGGGLTIYSDLNKEYNEMLEKVYVPIS